MSIDYFTEFLFLASLVAIIVLLFAFDVLLNQRISRLRRLVRSDELLIARLRKRIWALEARLNSALGFPHKPSRRQTHPRPYKPANGWGLNPDDEMPGGSGIELEEYPLDENDIPAFLRKQGD